MIGGIVFFLDAALLYTSVYVQPLPTNLIGVRWSVLCAGLYVQPLSINLIDVKWSVHIACFYLMNYFILHGELIHVS